METSADRVARSLELIEESVAQRVVFNTVDYTNQNVSDFLGYTDANARIAVPAQGSYITTLNRQQPACIANWATLGLDKPSFEFKPRETGDPPLYYLNTGMQLPNTPSVKQVMAGIKPNPDGTIDADSAAAVKTLIQQSQQASMQAKMMSAQQGAVAIPIPAALPDNLLVEVNDQTATEAYEELFDIFWENSSAAFPSSLEITRPESSAFFLNSASPALP